MNILLEIDLTNNLRPEEIAKIRQRAAELGITEDEVVLRDIRHGISAPNPPPHSNPAPDPALPAA